MYLFADARSYTDFLAKRYPGVPYRRALYVKDRGPGEVFTHLGHDFQIDLRHESTHALLHGSLPMVPLWLDEGLAKYFEVPRDQRANGSPYMSTVRWNARLGMIPRLPTLENKRDLREMGASEYRYSWAWVHFMLNGPPEAHDELIHYLADIAKHNPPGQLSQRLERRLPNLDAQLRGTLPTGSRSNWRFGDVEALANYASNYRSWARVCGLFVDSMEFSVANSDSWLTRSIRHAGPMRD